jgi:hypothetical protein
LLLLPKVASRLGVGVECVALWKTGDESLPLPAALVYDHPSLNRVAQTGAFHLDIQIFNWLFIDVCAAFAAETGLKSRNVEKKINAV